MKKIFIAILIALLIAFPLTAIENIQEVINLLLIGFGGAVFSVFILLLLKQGR